jgi:hypothetical protein
VFLVYLMLCRPAVLQTSLVKIIVSAVAEFANPCFQNHLVTWIDPRKYNSHVAVSRGIGDLADSRERPTFVVILILSLVPAANDLLLATPHPYKLKSVARA